jgi:hypothetical protein
MINNSLRTQLQNKINAATSATSLSDLMLMRVAAQGLNLNENNLDTLLGPKVDAVVTADPATSFVEAWRSLGLDGNVQYTVPFDTQAGDKLYIGVLGAVTKQKYPSQVSVSALFDPTIEDLKSPSDLLGRSRLGGLRRGVAGGSDAARAALVLSDGNILHIFSGSDYASAVVGIGVSVLSGTDLSVLNTTFADPKIGTDQMSNAANLSRLLGVFEVSPNIFRLWISTREAGTGSCRKIGYYVLTYNTGSKTISYSNGASLLVSPDGTDWSHPSYGYQAQGDRYVIVSHGNLKHYTLDLQNSTLIEHTTLAGQSAVFSQVDHSAVGYEHARVTYGSNVRLVRLGVTSLVTLPANLTSDGCFSNAHTVFPLGNRQWLSYNPTTGVCKVVEFNTTLSSCNIWTVGTAQPKLTSLRQVTRSGDIVRAYGRGYAFSFKWTPGSAPAQVNLNQMFPDTRSTPMDDDALVAPSTEYIVYGHLQVQDDTTKRAVKAFLRVSQVEYDPFGAVHFATVVEGNSAGQPVEISLTGNTLKSHKESTNVDVVSHQGLLTPVFDDAPFQFMHSQSGSVAETSNSILLTTFKAEVRTSAVSASQGVFAYPADVKSFITASGYASHTGSVTLFNASGRETKNFSASGSAVYSAAFFSARSAAAVSVASNSCTVYGGMPR